VGALLLIICLPIVARLARAEVDQRIVKLFYVGLVLKLAAAPIQTWVVDRFYNGVADSNTYNRGGAELAPLYRVGNWGYAGKIIGDGFMKIVTGEIYALVGVNRLAGFLVFSVLGYFGVYFFYRAFRLAMPEADGLRYARFLFLMPSLVFWSSSIGKEALMIFGLGLGAWGAARLFAQQRGGFVLFAAGTWLCLMVRPHVALLLFASVAVGYLVRRSRRSSPLNAMRRLVGIGVLAVAGAIVIQTNTGFFSVKSLNNDSVNEVLKKNQANLGAREGNEGEGFGSSEEARSLSPLSFPRSVVTILFRPFPHEASGAPSVAASLEGVFLLLVVCSSARRMWAAIKRSPRNPYVLTSFAFSVVFIYLFASLPNLGIIARERIQLLPFFLVLVCGPLPPVLNATRLLRPTDAQVPAGLPR
jgi:hypothetical protein